MPGQQTIKTGLKPILRPEFQHLVPVTREMAVTASFLRRQASLLLNVYLNKDDTSLPRESVKLQSFFTFAQGLFMYTFHQTAMTADKATLQETYNNVFDNFFSGENRITKPPIMSAQIRAYNARMMIANLKVHLFTNFFKFQYHTLKSQVDAYVPEEEIGVQDKKKIVNSMTMFISSQINRLVFVEDRDSLNSQSSNSRGSSAAEALDNPSNDNAEDDPKNLTNADEDSYLDADADADPDPDSDSESSDNESVDNQPTSRGELLVNTYIPVDDLEDLIMDHRRALGILLQENLDADHNFRWLTRTILKERNLISLILPYYKFLRTIRSHLDVRRFHLSQNIP